MTRILATFAVVIALVGGGTAAQAGSTDRPARYAPCANEDGPGPCVWDARHMGNGTGRSYYLTADKADGDGRARILPHHVAHYLINH